MTNKKVNEIQDGEFDALVCAAAVTPGQIRPEAFDEILRWMKPGKASAARFTVQIERFFSSLFDSMVMKWNFII